MWSPGIFYTHKVEMGVEAYRPWDAGCIGVVDQSVVKESLVSAFAGGVEG